MSTINRRSALLAISGAALIPLSPASAVVGSPRLNLLFEAHKYAKAKDGETWSHVVEMESLIFGKLPNCRVQVGRILRGRDDDGNETWTPIYSYSTEDIDSRAESNAETYVRLNARGPNAADIEKAIRKAQAEWAGRKKGELTALQAESKRIEDESGYTAALEDAVAISEYVKNIEAEIVAFVPDTLQMAAEKAAWVIEAFSEENGAYLSDRGEDGLIDALKAIARAGTV